MATPLALVWELIAVDKASTVFKKVGTEASAASKEASGFGTAMAAAGKVVGVAALGIAAVSAKMAGDFQQNTNVLVTAAGESVKNLGLIRKGILDISTGTGTSWKAVTDGIYGVEKAGYRGADALKILKAAAQGAREENANLATVTQAMTSVMASYHLNASDSVKVMNEMKTAAGEAKTTMELFSGSLSTVLPLASANKISFADIAGSLASLTQHGTSADEAAQELAFTMRGLAAPSAVAVKEMAALGISSIDVARHLGDGPGGRGLAGTLNYLSQTVLKKMGPAGLVLLNTFNQTKMAATDVQVMYAKLAPATQALAKQFLDGSITAAQWTGAIRKLPVDQANLARQFGVAENRARGFQTQLKNGLAQNQTYSDALKKMTGGANGLNTVLQLTGESMAGTNHRINEIAKSASSAGKDVSGWASTQKLFNVQIDMAKQTIDKWLIQLGTKLIPLLLNSAHWITENWKTMKPYVEVLGVAAAAVAALTVVTAIFNAVISANPIALVIIELAALTVGVMYAWKHFETFRTIVKDVWAVIKLNTKIAWDILKAIFAALVATVTATVTAVTTAARWLSTAWRDTWGAMKAAWDAVAPTLSVIGKIVYALVALPILVSVKAVRIAWQVMWDATKLVWDTVGRPVFTAVKVSVGVMWDGVKVIFDVLRTGWNLMWAAAKSAWDTVGRPMFDSVKAVVTGLWHDVLKPIFGTIGKAWNALWGAFPKAMSGAWDAVTSAAVSGINVIIDVLNGFIGAIDWILDKLPGHLHISKIDHIGSGQHHTSASSQSGGGQGGIKAIANGGVLPGYSPGVDSIRAILSPGEGILVPEAVRGLGADFVHWANSYFGGGRIGGKRTAGHFGIGGVIGGIGHAIKKVAMAPLRAALSAAEIPVHAALGALPDGMLKALGTGMFARVDHGIRSMLYDNGGMLMPGVTLAVNGTGRPERVMTNGQYEKHTGDHIDQLHVHYYGEPPIVAQTIVDVNRSLTYQLGRY